MKMFSIRDEKAEGFNAPFNQSTYGLAERAFLDALKDPNQLAKHPEDFSLWHVADFEQKTGIVVPVNPTLISRGTRAT